MGDRTQVEVRVLKGHEAAFEKITGRPPGAETLERQLSTMKEGWVLFEIDDAEWGLEEEAKKAAEAGLVFIGWNDEGGEYGPAVWAGLNGEFYFCASDWQRVMPVVKVHWEGVPHVDEFDLVCAKAYYEAVERIELIFAAKKVELQLAG